MNERLRVLAILLAVCLLSLSGWAQADDIKPGQPFSQVNETRRLLKNAVTALGSGEYQKALTALDSVTAIDATNADSFYYRGLTLLHSGDTIGARQTLTEGARVASLSSRIKLLLARLMIMAGEYDKARLQIDAVLAIKPHHGESHYLKGLVEVGLGDTTAAIQSFEKSLEIALPEGKR